MVTYDDIREISDQKPSFKTCYIHEQIYLQVNIKIILIGHVYQLIKYFFQIRKMNKNQNTTRMITTKLKIKVNVVFLNRCEKTCVIKYDIITDRTIIKR